MTTTTDANGNYQFSVSPSLGEQFEIQVIIPSGESATIQNAGPPGTYSVIYATGYSDDFFLGAGGAVNEANAGVVPGAAPPQADVYTWNPLTPATDILASHSQNWKLNGEQLKPNTNLPGDKPTDKVQFNGNLNNAGITWDAAFSQSGQTVQFDDV